MSGQQRWSNSEAEREMLRETIRGVPCPPPPKGCGAKAEQPCTRTSWQTGQAVERRHLECVARVRAALAKPGGGA